MRQKYTGPELDNPWNILQYGNDDQIGAPYPPTYGGYFIKDSLNHPVQGNGDLVSMSITKKDITNRL